MVSRGILRKANALFVKAGGPRKVGDAEGDEPDVRFYEAPPYAGTCLFRPADNIESLPRLPQATNPIASRRMIAIAGLPPMTKRWTMTAPTMTIASNIAPSAAVCGASSMIPPATSNTPVRYRNHCPIPIISNDWTAISLPVSFGAPAIRNMAAPRICTIHKTMFNALLSVFIFDLLFLTCPLQDSQR